LICVLAVTLIPDASSERCKLRNQHINFFVSYEIDEQEAEHALPLKNYRRRAQGMLPISVGFYLSR
jgi:hypothetical protein